MQANKDQNWTDDADFWDEAWADMNTRLDAEPKRRKGLLAWWPVCLGIAAVLLLALTLAGGILFEQGAPTVVSTTQAPEEAPRAGEIVNKSAGPETQSPVVAAAPSAPETSRTSNAANDRKTISQPSPAPGPVAPGYESPDNKVSTSEKTTYASSATNDQVGLKYTTPTSATKNIPDETEEVIPVRSTPEPSPGIFALAELRPLEADEPTDLNQLGLPAVPVTRLTHRNPFTAEAGMTSDFGLGHPGIFAGLGYRIKNASRLSFPITLRYRLDEYSVKDFPLGSTDQAVVVVSDPDTTGAVNETALTPRSITTTSLEVGAGLAFAATPRLRFSAGWSVSYQLEALVNFEGRNSRPTWPT